MTHPRPTSPEPNRTTATAVSGGRALRPLALAMLAVLAALLPACEQPQNRNDVPTTGEGVMRDREPQPKPLLVAIHRLDLLLEESTDKAWELVDESAFPPLTRTVWHANGLRPGILRGSDLARFADALPGVVAVQRSQLAPGDHTTALLAQPNYRAPIIVDLTIPPRAVREFPVRSGRLQLLGHFEALSPSSPSSGLRVELTPHQYVPQITLTPRDPMEQRLDGRVFTELTLRADLPESRMLVVGLFKPPSPDKEDKPDDAPAAPEGDEGEPPARIAASPAAPPADGEPSGEGDAPADGGEQDPPPKPGEDDEKELELPPNLGRALFTSRRMDRRTQVLLLISIEPGDRQPPAQPTP